MPKVINQSQMSESLDHVSVPKIMFVENIFVENNADVVVSQNTAHTSE